MPKVWVVNDSGHNFAAAERYGEIVRFTEGRVDIFHVDRLAKHLSEGVALSRPEDFLLFSGAPILNAIVLRQWLKAHGQVRMLQWNAITKQYELFEMEADHMDDLLDRALVGR